MEDLLFYAPVVWRGNLKASANKFLWFRDQLEAGKASYTLDEIRTLILKYVLRSFAWVHPQVHRSLPR